MKGIILAGGLGTRLHPLTKILSKQLLPVYDKPLIYYPISPLMLANIREILIISAPDQQQHFQNLLGDGSGFGISLSYLAQIEPKGIAESLILGEEFLKGQQTALILGDNIFHGPGLGRRLASFADVSGAQVFGYRVKNTEAYGIATLNSDGTIKTLEEKPKNSQSKIAIPGIYFFDNQASSYARLLAPSPRGELEIVDLLNIYHEMKSLYLEMLPRGTAWFDSGTFDDLHEAASYVRLMESRTGERVGDPSEIAKIQKWRI